MKLLTGHDNRCLLWSAAMVLDADPHQLIEEIGYTGLEVTRPMQPKPFCFRGHHIQEIVDVAWRRGVGLTLVQPLPTFPPRELVYPMLEARQRFKSFVEGRRAIFIGEIHAVAWDGLQIYDPNGGIYNFSQFAIREAWIKSS